ncbi:MAG: hypothetical protein HN350_01805 [Phycisphaerales bacterium]|jgi:hypothetical protein|nr:hypothetical protein [Phycisphaerales bacterium]
MIRLGKLGICIWALVVIVQFSDACHAEEPGRGKQRIFRVADFGAAGDGKTDDRAAIQKAIDAGVKSGSGATVRFEAARVYRLGRHERALGMLIVSGAEGLTLDGCGATLLSHPSNRIMAIHASKKIVLANLVLDYSPLPFTQGRMHVVSPKEGYVEFKAADGYAAPVLGGSKVYRDFKSSDCVFVRPDGAFTHSWLRISEITEPSPGVFRCRFHGAREHVMRQLKRTAVNDLIAVKMIFPQGKILLAPDGRHIATGAANINIGFCHDVVLRGITSYAAPGMTFNAHGSEALAVENCAVIRKPKTDRLIAGQSDGCHLKSLTIMPKITNCRFEALMDDSIAVKVSGEIVKRKEGNRVLLHHGDIAYNDCVVKAGDELELYDSSEKKHLGFAKVTATRRVGYRKIWATLANRHATLAQGDRVYLKPITPVEIKGCKFGSQLKTAISKLPPGVVSGCVFNDTSYGVHAFTDARWPCSGMPRGIVVRNCTFINNTVAALAWSTPSPGASPPAKFSLKVENCRFSLDGMKGYLLSAGNAASGISFKNCRVNIKDGRLLKQVVHTRNCNAVDITGIAIDKPNK